MRVFIAVLVLIFSFQSWTKADDINDFQIEGISIGDSLLAHFDVEKISKGLKDWYPDKTFNYTEFRDNKIKEFDKLGFFFKADDSNYKIYSISGIKFCKENIQTCYNLQAKMEKTFEKISNIKKDINTIKYLNDEDNGTDSIAKQTFYIFDNGDAVFIETKDWATDSRFHDNVSINVDTKIFGDWLESISN